MSGAVFISHASRDAESANAVCEALEAAGITTWIAPRDVVPGAPYATAILEAIADARACVVLLSEAANASPFLMREVERAVSLSVPVVPFRLDGARLAPALEFFLSATQHVVGSAPPQGAQLDALVRALTSRLAEVRNLVVSNLPSRNPFFTGRDDIIERVGAALERSGRVSLTGMPGVGKTQVALECAARRRGRYRALLWVHAESTDSVYGDVARLARLLRLSDHSQPRQERVLDSMCDWLTVNEGWLLVLDNADDLDVVAPLLSLGDCGDVLVTSRGSGGTTLAEQVRLEPLDVTTSATLLLRRSRRDEQSDDDAARAVATRLGGLPLALDQAGAFIDQTRSTPMEYLHIFDSEAAGLLAAEGGGSVAATLSLAFDRLEREDAAAADLLRLCAFLAPDAIPEEILTSGRCCAGEPLGEILERPLGRLEAMRSAMRYALLDRDPGTQTMTVHRLVQAVLVADLVPGEQVRWATHAGHALAAAFPGLPDYRNWPACERLVPHVLACADHLDRLGVESEELGRLISLVAVYLRQRARQRESEPLQERACAMLERTIGDDEMQLAWSLHNLGILNHDLGRLDRSEALCRRAHDIAERELDSDDVRRTWFLNSLARALRTQQRYDEAEVLLKRALHVWRSAETANPAEVAWPLQGLGDLYLASGRPDLAETVLCEAVDVRRAGLGPEHPHLAWSMASLGTALAKQGRRDEALPLLRKALAIAEAALGPTHGIVGIIVARYAEAIPDEAIAGELRERAAAIKRAR
jgi:tetratricopeptide (TPR) repeat protein